VCVCVCVRERERERERLCPTLLPHAVYCYPPDLSIFLCFMSIATEFLTSSTDHVKIIYPHSAGWFVVVSLLLNVSPINGIHA